MESSISIFFFHARLKLAGIANFGSRRSKSLDFITRTLESRAKVGALTGGMDGEAMMVLESQICLLDKVG